MVFSDTTNKNGLIQECEFWTNLGDGGISGDATLLKVFTSRINTAFDYIMPLLLSFTNYMKWDDINNTGNPVRTIDMQSGTANYTATQDGNSLDILNVARVSILVSATGTVYQELAEMQQDDPRAVFAMSPGSPDAGVPASFLKRGNNIFLYPNPNYSATNGIKLFYERQPSRFASTDTTKHPGIPTPFHNLLALRASYEWLLVNKPDNTAVITRIEAAIARKEQDLRNAIDSQFPTRHRMTPGQDARMTRRTL